MIGIRCGDSFYFVKMSRGFACGLGLPTDKDICLVTYITAFFQPGQNIKSHTSTHKIIITKIRELILRVLGLPVWKLEITVCFTFPICRLGSCFPFTNAKLKVKNKVFFFGGGAPFFSYLLLPALDVTLVLKLHL